MLCDRIAILADGRLAALGSSLDLKTQFGVGYTLTVVKVRVPVCSQLHPSFEPLLRATTALQGSK